MLVKALGGGGNAIAGAVSPSSGVSAASSGSSFAGSLANAGGNAVAGAAGMWLANKLFPLPQGPDARNLQAGTSSIGVPIQFTNTATKFKDEINTNITVNLSVIDPKNKLGGAGKKDIEDLIKTLGGKIVVILTDEKGNTRNLTSNITVTPNVKIANNLNEVRINDFIIGMVNSIPDAIGLANDEPGSVGAAEYYETSITAMVTVIFHELGHILGVSHEQNTFMNETVDQIDPKNQYRNVTDKQRLNLWRWIIDRIFGGKRVVPTIPDNKKVYKEFIQKESIQE